MIKMRSDVAPAELYDQMRQLRIYIDRIRPLIKEGSPSALTYAALECRLAIEFYCYERLRLAHDYISHKDLRRWQPKDVVNTLIREVDEHTASEFTLSFSPTPIAADNIESPGAARNLEWKEIGTQVSVDPILLGKLWHALSSFLHVAPAQIRSISTAYYSNSENILKKVNETLAELERLSNATLISSGFGENVSFECECGTKNARRVTLLRDDQTISCLNPDCEESWTAQLGDTIVFRRRTITITCSSCGLEHTFPERPILRLGRDHIMKFACDCGAENSLGWRLVKLTPSEE